MSACVGRALAIGRSLLQSWTLTSSQGLVVSCTARSMLPSAIHVGAAPWCTANSLLLSRLTSTTPPLAGKERNSEPKSYDPPSPYRKPGPRRFGYETKLYQGGVLPRPDTEVPLPFPRYDPKNRWDRQHALFGQNDYIDILGDGSVKPYDLLRGPRWLLGFRGNEMQRIIRRLKFEGESVKFLYPTQYKNITKRLRFLYKRLNRKRSKFHH